jgi:hypothetical protein
MGLFIYEICVSRFHDLNGFNDSCSIPAQQKNCGERK